MPASLSGSVRITSVDRAVVVAALRDWSDEIRGRKPEILAVGYFGSYATNRYVPGSDLDVIVILAHSLHSRFFDRTPELYPESFPVGVDVFAYTVEEIRRMKDDSSGWIRHVLNEAVWVCPPPAC